MAAVDVARSFIVFAIGMSWSLCSQGQIFLPTYTYYSGTESAGNATITNSTLRNTVFRDFSTAGQATIVNLDPFREFPGSTSFINFSNAGTARITNEPGGFTTFSDNSDASRATLVNNNGGFLTFSGSSSAGSSVISNNSGGTIQFSGTPSADAARVQNSAGATIDISRLSAAQLSIGSLEGAGSVFLGSKTLLLGALNENAVLAAALREGFGGGIGGSLKKVGTANLILTGASSYTGQTSIDAGTLTVNGSLVSPVSVNVGGILSGSGVITNTVTIGAGGTLAPGASIGTITARDIRFVGGSIYRVEIDAAGNSDRTVSTANVNIDDGSTVDVRAVGEKPPPTQRYTIVSAANTVSGRFTTAVSNVPFTTPVLSYDAQNVYLMLVPNSLRVLQSALTGNQSAVAGALASLVSTGTDSAAIQLLVQELNKLDDAQFRKALDAIGGAAALHASHATQLNLITSLFNSVRAHFGVADAFASTERLMFADATAGAALSSAATDSLPTGLGWPQVNERDGVWGRAFGLSGRTMSDDNANGYRVRAEGFTIGADRAIDNRLRAGGALSFAQQRTTVSNTSDRGTFSGLSAAVYGVYEREALLFRAMAGLAFGRSHSSRVAQVGTVGGVATAAYNNSQQALYADGAYRIPIGQSELQPILGVTYARTHNPGYEEQGAGVLSLAVAPDTRNSIQSLAGLRFVRAFSGADRPKFAFETRLLWAHEFGNIHSATASAQLAAGGTSFNLAGAHVGRDGLLAGVAWSAQMLKRLNFFAELNGEFRSRQNVVSLQTGLRYSW